MQTSLLSTKLYIPPTRERLVPRPRLAAILSDALAKGFTLVSAPAGYGKTTLVSSWLREQGIPSAWLSIEESDNDPVTFLQYLLATLQKVLPSIRSDLLDLVEPGQPGSFQALISILLNQVATASSQFVLVLDDFHLVHDPAVLDLVSFLLDHLAVQRMHLVLISRTDPPLPLSRLRVRDQMVEIRASQLRFTPAEVASFINGVMGFSLPAADISAMEARTEGWIAGLQLALLSMQGSQDTHGFISAFSGSHHYIVDYLVDEVLKRQGEPASSFLLKTSILSRMCASLCERVLDTGVDNNAMDGQRTLETLERMNLFLIPLDEERRWYRYHHLFADVLKRRLEYLYPDLPPQLYRRASAWYEENGLVGESIQSALDAGDLERVARLVEQYGCNLLMSGELMTLLKWMEAVEPYFSTHPWLLIQKGWALTLASRMQPAEQAFQQAEHMVSVLPPGPDVSSMVGTISAGRAYWADTQGNVSETSRLAQQALDLLPDTDPMSQSMRSVATGVLAKTIFMGGDLERARQIYHQAADFGRAANNAEMVINSNNDIADVLLEQGKLRQAEQLLCDTLPMTLRLDGQRLPLCSRVYAGLSKVYYEWNRLDQAEYYALQCLEVSRQWGNVEMQASATITLARVEQARCNLDRARALMQAADQLSRDHCLYPWTVTRLEAALDRFWLAMGNLDRVSQRLQTAAIHPEDEVTFLNELKYMTLLDGLLATGEYAPALGLAQRMAELAEVEQRMLRLVELLVFQSLALQGLKDLPAAVSALARAVSLAEEEGYKRVFLDAGDALHKLLNLVRSHPQAASYASTLLDALETRPGSASAPPQPLIEPLSSREIEVLKKIEAGLSNQEIASRLFISITTVKRHISNIYAKLDVKNRTQAVARGKMLGFFDG